LLSRKRFAELLVHSARAIKGRPNSPPHTRHTSSAEAFNLPLLPPSIPEESTGQFATGANFAFFAATALSADFYKRKYNVTISPPSDLDSQLDSFKKVLARIAPGER
jgi:hypothetical protein